MNKINNHYKIWNVRINPEKSETILLSKTTHHLSTDMKVGKNNFKISTTKPDNNELIDIPHKKVVKYLGVNIYYLLSFNQHVETQLTKAKKAFLANGRIFYNKNLSRRAKVICYQLLIRPILAYAAPIW